jgi:hypothetical protein
MKRWSPAWLVLCVTGLMLGSAIANAASAALHLDIQLVWGTDAAKSPDPNQKPVDEALAKRLAKSPFKWKNYFEVSQQHVDLSGTQANPPVKMSEHCTLTLRSLGGDRVEIKLQGDGKPVSTHIETLQDDWPLILSGDAKNNTAWLVVIQKVSDKKAK